MASSTKANSATTATESAAVRAVFPTLATSAVQMRDLPRSAGSAATASSKQEKSAITRTMWVVPPTAKSMRGSSAEESVRTATGRTQFAATM